MNPIPHCLQDKTRSQKKQKKPKEASFNQSTLFSVNNSSFLDHQLGLKGQRKSHVQGNCVTFVEESFMSENEQINGKMPVLEERGRVGKKGKGKKNKPKKKYNFMKKIINVSKKKLKNAKQFFMQMGNKKAKKSNVDQEKNIPSKK
jgi:hypothetical protein